MYLIAVRPPWIFNVFEIGVGHWPSSIARCQHKGRYAGQYAFRGRDTVERDQGMHITQSATEIVVDTILSVGISAANHYGSICVLLYGFNYLPLPRIRIYAIECAGLLIRQGYQDVGAVSPLGHWYIMPLPTIRRPWLYLLMLQIVGHYPVPLLPTMWILCAGLIAKVTRVHVQKRSMVRPTAFDSLVLHDATYYQWICALFVLPGF